MKAIVVAGGLPQITLISQLKERGIKVVLLDGNENAIARPYSDIFYKVNIFDVEAVKEIAVKEKADFLITVCADQVLLVVAQVSEMLGLPWYIDYETAKQVSDKKLMKEIFKKNNIPTSEFVVMKELDLSQIQGLHYPLIVKPVDAYSSKGVRKVDNEQELKDSFEIAAQISRNKNVIIEEYFEGEEISVDLFVLNGKAHVLCVSNSEKVKAHDRFVIFRGKFPVHVSEKLMKKIENVSQKIAESFQIRNAPMLVQMLTNGENITVLEFCARTGGAMKWLLIKRACGVDVISNVIDLTLGEKPNINVGPPENKYIVNDFIYCTEGIFDHLEGFDQQLKLGNITDYRCLRAKGTKFTGNINSSSDRILGVTIQADSIEEFNHKQRNFVNSVKIIDIDGNDIMRHDLLPDLTE
ncbi:MAG TPA: ATP-grasp domain-containing protein [[Clostridium] spiroforme]|uniref:ATP-grasp domain-containing protein n=1 Tax=Thomasclavelia spiroformis TaxID=29348 RepID=A0A921GE01_9FIRM|nr:ATP-grasp domain-containing protein [Thomasclavelia spiroformis]